MELRTEVLIIGGGLAGLSSAIHLSSAGKQVVLIEKRTYPHHKVCGEYISNEVLPYLRYLKADPAVLFPTQITKLQISNVDGSHCETKLGAGGFGLSRYCFDHFLYERAIAAGCTIVHQKVDSITFQNDVFEVHTSGDTYRAKIVLGAYGKRAQLDHALERPFIQKRSGWLAVKAHYKAEHPSDLVALHNFHGGYCGVSKVERDIMNVCYLVNYDSFKGCKNLSAHQEQVMFKNPHLKAMFSQSELLFDQPMTISQISFEDKEKVKGHILMVGDTAGLIHPLCGNGMSMAIHAAAIASTLVLDFLNGAITSRKELEGRYVAQWNAQFKSRIQMGRLLSGILLKPAAANLVMKVLVKFPGLFNPIISLTHGRPIAM